MNTNFFNPTFLDSSGAVITNLTYSQRSQPLTPSIYGSTGLVGMSWFGTADNVAPAAAVIASGSDVIDSSGSLGFRKSAHGFYTGLIVRATTSSALPTGLSTSTDYFVIRVSASVFTLATSLANALNNVAIAYTDTGTGNQTLTPTALAGCSVKLQASYDLGQASTPTWFDVPNASVAITADASFGPYDIYNVLYPNYAVYFTITTGQVILSPLQIGYGG